MPKVAFTPETVEALCEQLKQGIPKVYAAGYVGIHRDTLHNWEQRGKHAAAKLAEGAKLTAGEQAFLDAAEQLQLARDYGVAWLMHQILLAASGEKGLHLKKWQAYMTVLERTHADDFRRKSSSEYVDRDKQGGSRLDVSKLEPDERAVLRGLLQKATGGE